MRNQHQQALQHALDALGDGSGHQEWGPGPVILKLDAISAPASEAFGTAALVAVKLGHQGRKKMTAAIRKLAPVLLEVIQGDDP